MNMYVHIEVRYEPRLRAAAAVVRNDLILSMASTGNAELQCCLSERSEAIALQCYRRKKEPSRGSVFV